MGRHYQPAGFCPTNLRTASGHVNRGFGLKFYHDESEYRAREVPHRELTS